MSHPRSLIRGLLAGSGLGVVLLGGGGRIIIRCLARWDGRSPAFSWGGTIDILAYAGLAGCLAGFGFAALPAMARGRWLSMGLASGMIVYAVTLLTLPAHIAAAAEPFAPIIVGVHLGFGALFASFGAALGRALRL